MTLNFPNSMFYQTQLSLSCERPQKDCFLPPDKSAVSFPKNILVLSKSKLEGLNILQKYKMLLKSALVTLHSLQEKDGLKFLIMKNSLLIFKLFR